MSVEAFSWALQVPIGGNAKIILLGIANHASAEMTEARPSVPTLARYANCHPRTVQRMLRELEAAGWIIRTGSHPVAGRPDRSVTVWALAGCQSAAPHGVTESRGVTSETDRGDTGVVNGVTPVPPEPSLGTVQEPSVLFSAAKAAEAEREDVVSLCNYLANAIVANDQRAKPKRDSAGWRDAARLLLDVDERPYEEVVHVIRWCQTDPFWKTNVLSMVKLREKYPQLLLKMNSTQAPRNTARSGWSTEEILAAGRESA